jgi:hypothetical protein
MVSKSVHKVSQRHTSIPWRIDTYLIDLDELLPLLHTLKDDAVDWAKPTIDFMDHSDSDTERDPDSRPNSSEIGSPPSGPSLGVLVSTTTVIESTSPAAEDQPPSFGRRPSSVASATAGLSETEEQELRRVGKLILALEPEDIAQEITRADHELFMSIQVCLNSAVRGKKLIPDHSRETGYGMHTQPAATVILQSMHSIK